ncbi:glutaredoxin-like protein C5orf63 homolog [Mycetomoellerius zeteki]|uniref:glutaredoxin-like protein C5orf63 homolog n=1 Tax=Mycetomoellerius zeteki TaxID=64791 RepID=UPI00084E7884|nr:PREDICTED: glutaredoxin-like protein C5orf63 homolog [Trachymyrmex zeteki]
MFKGDLSKVEACYMIFRSHPISSPPKLTLYTKSPCLLCDILKNELRLRFAGRYQLEEVDIAAQENEQYFQLYKYDIPVLFLEGQYLCKHRLDADLLERRLDELVSRKDKCTH